MRQLEALWVNTVPKVRYLDPENFSKELVLNFNLGPLKDLDGLIDEVLALDSA